MNHHRDFLFIAIISSKHNIRVFIMSFFCLAEVGPKKILDLMNVPWLTRENVASHLQVHMSWSQVFLLLLNDAIIYTPSILP